MLVVVVVVVFVLFCFILFFFCWGGGGGGGVVSGGERLLWSRTAKHMGTLIFCLYYFFNWFEPSVFCGVCANASKVSKFPSRHSGLFLHTPSVVMCKY